MNITFKKDDFVVYGKNGVCCIEDIKTMTFAGIRGDYYILKPQAGYSSTVYIPVTNEALVEKIRPVMSKKQIDTLLEDTDTQNLEWIEVKNERIEKFNQILSSGDNKALLGLIMCVYRKKQEKEALGKSLSSTDENILRLARELIEEEFAFSLGCPKENVADYIQKKLK